MTTSFVDNQEKAKKALFYACKASLRKAGGIIAKETKANIPKRTGNGRRFIHVHIYRDKETIAKGSVGYLTKDSMLKKGKPVPFENAQWLENGTKQHKIKAGEHSRAGKVLYKTGKKLLSNGTTKFGREFMHPGTKANRPLANAAKSKSTVIEECAKEFYSKIDQMYQHETGFFAEIAAEAGGERDIEEDGE